jgi:hypothetical protein
MRRPFICGCWTTLPIDLNFSSLGSA